MVRTAIPVLCLLVASCHCDTAQEAAASNPSPSPSPPASRRTAEPEPTTMPAPTWQGPAAECSVDLAQTTPLTYLLHLSMTVPSGGYELTHDRTEKTAAGTRVYLTLTGPSPEEGVIMMLETKKQEVDLGTEPGKACLVYICAKVRNARYIKAPEHDLARVVPIPGK